MAFNMMNLRGKVQQIALALLLLAFSSQAQTIASMVDAVSDSAIFSTIAGLQRFGTRYYSAANTLQVSDWVRQQFLAAGLADAVLDTFFYEGIPLANVVATLTGTRYAQKEIIVGAHIDSRALPIDSAPGADDDASGTAAILEIARVLVASGYHPSVTIRFIGFAAEEPGLEGSYSYVQRARGAKKDIIIMMNFDMIGYTTSANPERQFNIIYYPPDTEFAGLVASAATSYSSLKPVMTTVDHSNVDSYTFAVAGYDAISCHEFLANPFYHTSLDLIGTLDSSYVRDVTRVGLAAVLLFDETPSLSAPGRGEVPLAMRLYPNFPNPFNPFTIIRYTVGGNGAWGKGERDVSLIVFDLLGREMAVLVNVKKSPGNYEVRFDGSGLTSGVYYYRLTAGEFSQARAMMLLK